MGKRTKCGLYAGARLFEAILEKQVRDWWYNFLWPVDSTGRTLDVEKGKKEFKLSSMRGVKEYYIQVKKKKNVNIRKINN